VTLNCHLIVALLTGEFTTTNANFPFKAGLCLVHHTITETLRNNKKAKYDHNDLTKKSCISGDKEKWVH